MIGISPDPPAALAKFRKEHNLPFILLSNPDHTVASAYGAWGKKGSKAGYMRGANIESEGR